MTVRGLRLLGCAIGAVVALSGCAGTPEPATAPPADRSATTAAPAPGAAPASPSPGASSPPAAAAPPAAPPAVVDPATVPEPLSVAIPALGVGSELLDLGVTADGSAQVPEQFELAGWFAPGGRPGARGPTVLMGHVDSTAGPAVFYDLRRLVPGDVVEVTVADGSVARYAVTGTEQVPKDTFPTAAVFGATIEDVLRLITCSGTFDRGERSYVDNLVVTAERTG